MQLQRIRETERVDEGEAAAPAVERVRAHRRVADRDEAVHDRRAVGVDERAVPVAQAGHHVHVGDRIGDALGAPRRGRKDRCATVSNASGCSSSFRSSSSWLSTA